jgi:hypothetical protein
MLIISDKTMFKKIILTQILVFTFFFGFTQSILTNKATLSVLTCGPGDQLYSTFGHSAFRIHDASTGFDKIYNYGTFDFNAPNFYLNFAKGKLTYQLSTTRFQYFLAEYRYENRWVKEQLLNLNPGDVQLVYNYLENNAKPENKNYQYDFFFDNCSTKIETVLVAALPNKIEFSNNHITTHKTHRDLIADYTKNQKWAKFGIDLALGSVIDREATKDEYKFIPDYIFKAFENATIKTASLKIPLVKKEYTIIEERPMHIATFSLSPTPFFTLLFLSLVILFITYKNFKSNKRTKLLDFLILLATGIIGIVVLLLWFATSHTATYKNLNFLWAFAPNFIISFYLLKSKLANWLKTYFIVLVLLLVTTFVVWIAKVQIFNGALLIFMVSLLIRYLYIISTFQKKQ